MTKGYRLAFLYQMTRVQAANSTHTSRLHGPAPRTWAGPGHWATSMLRRHTAASLPPSRRRPTREGNRVEELVCGPGKSSSPHHWALGPKNPPYVPAHPEIQGSVTEASQNHPGDASRHTLTRAQFQPCSRIKPCSRVKTLSWALVTKDLHDILDLHRQEHSPYLISLNMNNNPVG